MKNAGPFVEIYAEDVIRFVVILDKNEGFYVPEVSPTVSDETKKMQ